MHAFKNCRFTNLSQSHHHIAPFLFYFLQPSMSTYSHAEILEYLNHGDADLAVRRLLDYCLDTGQDALICEAIRLSQS